MLDTQLLYINYFLVFLICNGERVFSEIWKRMLKYRYHAYISGSFTEFLTIVKIFPKH